LLPGFNFHSMMLPMLYPPPGPGGKPSCLGRKFRASRAAFLLFALAFLLSAPAFAVTEVSDCSEDALNQAFQDAAADDGIIVFTEDCDITLTAPITIDPDALGATDFTLDSQGHNVSVHGDVGVRVFEVLNAANVNFLGITIADGQTNQGGGLFITSDSTVVLTNCTLVGNTVTGTNGADGSPGLTNTNGSGGNGTSALAGESVAGAAIYNLGTLSLFNCVIASNTATGGNGGAGGSGGSGLFNAGSGGNGGAAGTAWGGAIYSSSTNDYQDVLELPELVVSNCTFSANTVAGGSGGAGGARGTNGLGGVTGNGGAGGAALGAAIYATNRVVVWASTFSANTAQGGTSAAGGTQQNGNGTAGPAGGAASGGGLFAIDLATTNCTFYLDNAIGGTGGNGGPGTHNSGNGGNGGNATGGGIYSIGNATVISCTFSNCNAFGGTNGLAGSTGVGGVNGSLGASHGGNIARAAGTFALGCTILATNSSGGAGFGTVSDLGYNIYFGTAITLNSGSSIKTNNAKLGPLANYGGPTLTMLPLAGSPALDRIPTNAFPLRIDQRGFPRPINRSNDIGSVELEQELGPPVITVQPTNPAVLLGSNATVTVTAHGSPVLKYFWQLNGSFISGATRSSFVITNAAPSNAGPYTVIVSNNISGTPNTTVSVPVFAKFAPFITNQPVSVTINPGQSALFFVGVLADTNNLTYQWSFNGSELSDATRSSLTITNAQSTDAGSYSVAVSNAFGGTISSNAILSLYPAIITSPTNTTVLAGSSTILTVNAAGSAPLTYQWRFNGNFLNGNNGSALAKANVQTSDAGTYDVIVTNLFGAVTSAPATLSVVSSFTQPVLSSTISTGKLSMSFTGQAGVSYVIDVRTSIVSGAWTPLVTNAGTNGLMTFLMPTTNAPSAFFRVRTQ
jgi:hypothetical protein